MSQFGVLEGQFGGQGVPPVPRVWLGESGTVSDTGTQVGNDNSLPATNSQVAEDPTPEPKPMEIGVEEEEVINTSLEPGT